MKLMFAVALSISPENDKVRLRRAKVNEKIGKFTSLSEALEGGLSSHAISHHY
jgi:hypothetical protein